MRRSLSCVLSICLLFQLVSCSSAGGSGDPSQISGSQDQTASAVIPDNTASADTEKDPADSIYFNSKSVIFDQEAMNFEVAKMKSGYLVLAESWWWNDDNTSDCNVTGYIIDKDYNISSSFDLGKDTVPYELCMIDDKRFAVPGDEGEEYRIYDITGKLLKTGEDKNGLCERIEGYDSEIPRKICAAPDGFIVATNHRAVKYDKDGNTISSVSYHDDEDIGFNSVFIQDGQVYISVENSDDYSPAFERIDFDYGTCTKICNPAKDFGIGGIDLEESTFYGQKSNSKYLPKIDIAGNRLVNIAAYSNMLMCPPTYDASSLNDFMYVLDDEHFYIPYCYEDLNVSEIVFIYRDDTLDLSARKIITVQGLGTNSDIILRSSAYCYNNMQTEYFIKVEDLSEKVTYGSSSDTARSIARISADYMNGNAPDIFYGNTFDYDYWGRNNVVIDMKPYLEKNGAFREGDITPYVLKLMEDNDGHIYQTFAGYNMFGYWGRKKDFDRSSYAISDLKSDKELFGNVEASEICYYTLGSNLKQLYLSGGLTKENVASAVDLSINSGIPPVTDPMEHDPVTPASVGSGQAKLLIRSVSNAVSYDQLARSYNDTPSLVGFPSAGASSHMIEPSVCLMAVSASSSDPQGCCDFISYFYSAEMQRRIAASGAIPVNNSVLNEYLGYLQDPSSMTEEQLKQYRNVLIHKDRQDYTSETVPMSPDLLESYKEQLSRADTISVFDWGVYDIIVQEIGSHYSKGKSVDEVAESLYSRLDLYAKENY